VYPERLVRERDTFTEQQRVSQQLVRLLIWGSGLSVMGILELADQVKTQSHGKHLPQGDDELDRLNYNPLMIIHLAVLHDTEIAQILVAACQTSCSFSGIIANSVDKKWARSDG